MLEGICNARYIVDFVLDIVANRTIEKITARSIKIRSDQVSTKLLTR